MRRPKPLTVYFAITLNQDASLISARGKVDAIEGMREHGDSIPVPSAVTEYVSV